jgi:hypothetical protein
MAFTSKLEHEDGTPADPPTLHTAVPNWSPGDTIPLGRRTLRVIEIRTEKDSDVLVVESVQGAGASRTSRRFPLTGPSAAPFL